MAKFAAKASSIAYLSGSTYIPIVNCKTISFDTGGEVDKVDVTTLDNADNYRDYVSTWINTGSTSISGPYDPGEASHAFLRAQAGNDHSIRITWSDTGAATETFSATVGGLQIEADADGALTFTCPLAILGAPTHSA